MYVRNVTWKFAVDAHGNELRSKSLRSGQRNVIMEPA